MKSGLHNFQELKCLKHCCTAESLKNCLKPCHTLPCSCFTFNNLCKLINLILGAKEIPTSVQFIYVSGTIIVFSLLHQEGLFFYYLPMECYTDICISKQKHHLLGAGLRLKPNREVPSPVAAEDPQERFFARQSWTYHTVLRLLCLKMVYLSKLLMLLVTTLGV